MKHNESSIQHAVSQSFENNFGFQIMETEFLPIGEESYAYMFTVDTGKKYFAKYCEKATTIGSIGKVNELLLQLAHFPFVVPPVEARGHNSFDVLRGKLYVYPYIEGDVIRMSNDTFDTKLVNELTHIMARIHTATPTVDVPRETFKNTFHQRLNMLIELSQQNKFENEVKQLLIQNKKIIMALIDTHTAINKYIHAHPPFVLTHGDITGLNLIQSNEGIKLVDWDGACFAPAERDLMFLVDNPHFSLESYTALTKRQFNPELKEYYNQEWALQSIIGNFEHILNDGKAKGSTQEYIDEINEYVGYYK